MMMMMILNICNKQQHYNLARKQSKKKQSRPTARM
jgi:hypothetical protein